MALLAEFRSEGKEQEWNLIAMHILLWNMPSRERELWHEKRIQERLEMEFWPLELYKFMTRRWEDLEDTRMRRRIRAKPGKRRRRSNNPAPFHSTTIAVSAVAQGAAPPGEPEVGGADWGDDAHEKDEEATEYHHDDEPGQDGDPGDSACSCESEDSSDLSELEDNGRLTSGREPEEDRNNRNDVSPRLGEQLQRPHRRSRGR
jgi:hypothetical protein